MGLFSDLLIDIRDNKYPAIVQMYNMLIGINPAGLDGKVDKITGKGLSEADFTSAEKTKLGGIANNANNYAHPNLHPASIIDGFAYPNQFLKTDNTGNSGFGYVNWSELAGKPATFTPSDHTHNGYLSAALLGTAGGVCPLGSDGKIDTSYLSSLNVMDVWPVEDQASMLALSSAGKGDFAIVADTVPANGVFILGGLPASTLANWIPLNFTAAVSSVNGKVGIVTLTKTDIGLSNVDNTSDLLKPLSDAAVSALALKAPLDSPTFTGSVGGITKIMVGLGNVDNTADANKNVQSATKFTTVRNINGVPFDGTADIEVLATATNAAIENASFLDTDIFGFLCTVPGAWRKITGANFKAALKTYFDTVYTVLASPAFTGTPTVNGISVINFTKPHQGSPLFTKTSVSTITIPIGTSVKVGANIITVSGSAYTLSLNSVAVGALDTGIKVAGTDYYVYALEAGGFILSANATNPTGYTTANSRKIGGFHYGVIPEAFTAINNITAADATKIAGINAYSLWDLKFMPANGDARGMFKANTGKWYDIYLLNIDHHLYGTSAAGKTIAGGTVLTGRDFPKIPLFYGGNGTTTYGTLTWFEAAEIGKAYGKDLISYEEFAAIAYGVLEASSAGAADTGVTQHLANYTSKFGMCMATGCEWIWGKDLIGPAGGAWNTNTEGRGSIYNASLIGALFGGNRDGTVEPGSRASDWNYPVWTTYWNIGSRYACDHLELA